MPVTECPAGSQFEKAGGLYLLDMLCGNQCLSIGSLESEKQQIIATLHSLLLMLVGPGSTDHETCEEKIRASPLMQ
jgi:hypothetical protein